MSEPLEVVAVAAAATALLALVLAAAALVQLRRVRSAQKAVLGDEQRDLVAHAAELDGAFEELRAWVGEAAERLDGRMSVAEVKLDTAMTGRALLRYDAFGDELSGNQSTTIALVDAHGSGVVLSSIVNRDTARLYAKHITEGRADVQLTPEEQQAVAQARAGS